MDAVRRFLAEEHHRHPWMVPGLLLTGSAALGSSLTDIVAFVGRMLS